MSENLRPPDKHLFEQILAEVIQSCVKSNHSAIKRNLVLNNNIVNQTPAKLPSPRGVANLPDNLSGQMDIQIRNHAAFKESTLCDEIVNELQFCLSQEGQQMLGLS